MRVLTDHQFSDGTEISGTRIDEALADVVEHVNAVPHGDLANRWLYFQCVAGFMPSPPDYALATDIWRLPFLQEENHTGVGGIFPGTTAPPAVDSQHRVKGIYQYHTCTHWVWTQALRFPRPVRLVDITLALLVDNVYPNTFQYTGSPPPEKAKQAYVDDISIVLSVDHPWAPEDRTQNAVEFARHKWSAMAELFRDAGAPGAPTQNMCPSKGYGNTAGLVIRARDLDIPLFPGARIRLCLVLPNWAAGSAPWGDYPTAQQAYNSTLTFAEEVVE